MSQGFTRDEVLAFNEETVALILEDGFDAEDIYVFEHHFSADDFERLEKAAIAAFKSGLDVSDAEEFEDEETGKTLFGFDIYVEQQLDLEKLNQRSLELMELASRFNIDYDGWGIDLEEDEEE